MKTILVTGGAGYIGSHTTLELIKNGYDVVIFDNLEHGHTEIVDKLKTISKYDGKVIDFIKGDLKNPNDIDTIFNKYRKIDAVIHFAAYIQVEESVKNPQKYYENNVGGSINLFSAMLKNEVKKIVFSSTAAVYGEPKDLNPIKEDCEKAPINPYGRSKLMVEQILQDYSRTFGIKSAILRYFNVAGANSNAIIGEWHEPETHLIPNILRAVNGKIFQLFGDDFETRDGTCVRDYVNVEDLANAHLLALKYLELEGILSDCFNIGTNNGNTVKEVFDACEKVLQRKIDRKICARRAGDPASLVACNEKAKNILKWTPQRSLEDSIRSAYKWQCGFLEKI
ncbi:MAG: UDP-glucose 4-epimerase GalE [Alphaproteobacteria bacterium]|nr:UDP-glucose 4-epimerase GalE [Alphaproteobacteria bacterium]